ncbi:MAG: A/G-specific adenine glycosylase [Gammaproteobacteria bacterium]
MPDSDTGIILARWQKRAGRHNLPWQADRDPYKIWLAEVMLQQTQVAAAAPYYARFLRRFPTVAVLAKAREDSVMTAWSGLGYYRRAANLHRAAKVIAAQGFPQTFEGWLALPGIGKSTAGAISVFALGERRAILDGNAKRVLARLFAMETPLELAVDDLWSAAQSLLPPARYIRAYTQGIMDLGSMVCLRSRPLCDKCPLTKQCAARQSGRENILPQKRATKSKPQRKTTMALIRCGESLIVQKRNKKGVWRGLWSLPEDEDTKVLCRKWQKCLPGLRRLRRRSVIHHQFTHYALTAEVLYFSCDKKHPESPGDWRWLPPSKLSKTALPSPIRKLLEVPPSFPLRRE